MSFPRTRESSVCIDLRLRGGDRKKVVIPAKAGIQRICIDPRFHEGDGKGKVRG